MDHDTERNITGHLTLLSDRISTLETLIERLSTHIATLAEDHHATHRQTRDTLNHLAAELHNLTETRP